MGLLSFLSFRKTSDESQEIPAGNIKARAYNATAPSLTPFKGKPDPLKPDQYIAVRFLRLSFFPRDVPRGWQRPYECT